jgi:NADH-quinone oxidoreductase subunit G
MTDLVNIEVNGVPMQARKGAMIIEVTDAACITVPRFCYHSKLPIAANCRMCLVEVERAPKPLPACATPVCEGMKIFTHSDKAREAQRGVMEFLLINHPLDCPICDQGGECELQDLAVGYGRGVSRFSEQKRVVLDKDVGPLISTELTRCIHCTRCIRFLDVVAGEKELGATGRGENMTIGTYIARAIGSEVSGNVIDVCPVGALTSKPFRFSARAWELIQRQGVSAHDALGSSLYYHVRRGEVMRVVPRDNEAVNEVWLSDRDRFGYQGLRHAERLLEPMLKENGQWRTVDWETALTRAAEILKGNATSLGALASPSATTEELYLFQKLVRGLGSNNLDHRLRHCDFSDQQRDPLLPTLGMPVADTERLDGLLLIGCNLRKELPLLALRVRKAVRTGARVVSLASQVFPSNFSVAAMVAAPQAQITQLARIALAVSELARKPVPEGLTALAQGAPDEAARAAAAALMNGQSRAVWLGAEALHGPYFSALRSLAVLIAELASATLGLLTEGANSAGAHLAGVLPHRGAGGAACAPGLDAQAQFTTPQRAYLLLGTEPEYDCHDPLLALTVLDSARVVMLSAYVTERMREYADVLLPMAASAENEGSFVNLEGCWQGFGAAVNPPGAARASWKVLRLLANRLGLEDFDYNRVDEVRDELTSHCAGANNDPHPGWQPPAVPASSTGLQRIGSSAPYALDAELRRADALQKTPDSRAALCARLHPREAERLGLADAREVRVGQGSARTVVTLTLDEGIAGGCVVLASGTSASAALGAAFGTISVERAS